MKNKFLKIFYLFYLIFLVSSCEKDYNINDINSHQKSGFIISNVSSKDIQKNPILMTKINVIKERNDNLSNSENKIVYSADHGFTILTDYGKYIEDLESGTHSYSFPLIRDNPTDNKVENLLLNSNQENGYDSYIVKYGFTKNEYSSLDTISINKQETTITPIDFDTSVLDDEVFSKAIYTCEETWEFINSIEHNGELHGISADGSCMVNGCNYGESVWVLTGITCGYSVIQSGNTDGSPIDDNPTGGNGGGGFGSSGTSDPGPDPTDPNNHGENIVTTPALPSDDLNINHLTHGKNCEKLHDFSTSPCSQNEFISQENDVDNMNESGFIIRANPNNSCDFTTHPVQSQSTCSEMRISPNNALIYSIMHVHANGCGSNGVFPMFGPGDLFALYSMSQNYSPEFVPDLEFDNSIFTVYMTVEGFHYAIKIEDIQKLNQMGNIINDEDKIKRFRRKIIYRYEKANGNSSNVSPPTQVQLAVALLKFMNIDYDLGISLYRTSHDDINFDPTLPLDEQTSNWEQLTINENNNLQTTKC